MDFGNNNNSRLGKGLDALIPKNQPGQAGGSGQEPASSPAPVSHTPPAEPARIPIEPERELPAPEAHAGLPDMPEEALPEPAAQERLPAAEPAAAKPEAREAEPPRENSLYEKPAKKDRSKDAPEAIFQIEVDKIKPNPDQPRRFFDEAALRDLASSIREFGLLQPIVVTKVEHEVPTGTEVEYILISGERRLMASKLLGLPRVPAIIRNVGLNRERLELAIIENIQREQLNSIETARAMARLQDEFRMTQREIAARLGKSREVVANTVRLLDLPMYIQKAIEDGKISESHGRLLLAIDEQAVQERLYKDLVERGMTTRELRQKVDAAKPKQGHLHRGRPALMELSPEMKMLQEKLTSQLGAPVKIQQDGESGKITITFYSEEELKQIADKLGGGDEAF